MAFKTALIVDDSKLARITLKKKLEEKGLTVEMAKSADEAFACLPFFNPDIIFMDHQMPGIDGFEATQQIRLMSGFIHTPIIMCSGTDKEDYLQEAKAIGANQILGKPPVDHALDDILASDFSVPAESMVEETVLVEPVVEKTVVEEAVVEEPVFEEPVAEVGASEPEVEEAIVEVAVTEQAAEEASQVEEVVEEATYSDETVDGEFDFEEMLANSEPLPESYLAVPTSQSSAETADEMGQDIQIDEISLDTHKADSSVETEVAATDDEVLAVSQTAVTELVDAITLEEVEPEIAVSELAIPELTIPELPTSNFTYEDIQNLCRRLIEQERMASTAKSPEVDMTAVTSLVNLLMAQQVPSIMEKLQRELGAPISKIETQYANIESMIVNKVTETLDSQMEGILELSVNAKVATKFAEMDKTLVNLEKKILMPRKSTVDPMDTAMVLRQTGDQHKSIELMYEDLRTVKKNLKNLQILSGAALVLASLATITAAIVFYLAH